MTTTSDSEGAASGGELSEAEIERLLTLTRTGQALEAWHIAREALMQRLLGEHRERGERIAALEQEVKLLRAYWDSECVYHVGRSCKDWCSKCRENAEAVEAVQAHERVKLAAHDTKQGQGGESGSNNG